MITGLGHIAFCITDLEKSRDFYGNKLGLREVFRLERKHDPSHWIIYIQVAQVTSSNYFLLSRERIPHMIPP